MTGQGIRLLICGGRAYTDAPRVRSVLASVARERGPIACVIEGGATGADSMARAAAEARGIPVFTCRANWTLHSNSAGAIRNAAMLEHGKPDLVLAFPGGKGTLDMVTRAERAGVPVIQVRE